MNRNALREPVIVALTLGLLLLPLALLGFYAWQQHQWALGQLEDIAPRHARLLGLEKQKSVMDTTLAQARALQAQYLYPAEQDATQAGNAAQQKVRDIFSSAGLQIISSQVMPPKTEKGFDRIALTVRTEGEALAVQSALAVLSSQIPVIVLQDLDVQVMGGMASANPPRLSASFSLAVLQVHP